MRLVDTAGLRKRAKIDDKLEKLSAADTRRSIEHAEVVVLLLDATRGLEAQDLRIADHVIEEGRALIIALNKWDVAEHASSLFNGVKAALEEGLSQLKGVPVLAISAKTGKGVDEVLKVAFELREILVAADHDRRAQPLVRGRGRSQSSLPRRAASRIKLRYITQVKTRPPTFVVFGTRVDQLPDSYRRYLLNSMRRDLKLAPVPMRLSFRAPKNPFDSATAKANFTLCAVSRTEGPWPRGRARLSDDELENRRLGAFREEPGRAWRRFHPHSQLLPRGWSEVGRSDRRGDARPEYGRARPSRAHASRARRASSARSRSRRSPN